MVGGLVDHARSPDIDKQRRDSVKVSVKVSAPPSQARVDKRLEGKQNLEADRPGRGRK